MLNQERLISERLFIYFLWCALSFKQINRRLIALTTCEMLWATKATVTVAWSLCAITVIHHFIIVSQPYVNVTKRRLGEADSLKVVWGVAVEMSVVWKGCNDCGEVDGDLNRCKQCLQTVIRQVDKECSTVLCTNWYTHTNWYTGTGAYVWLWMLSIGHQKEVKKQSYYCFSNVGMICSNRILVCIVYSKMPSGDFFFMLLLYYYCDVDT